MRGRATITALAGAGALVCVGAAVLLASSGDGHGPTSPSTALPSVLPATRECDRFASPGGADEAAGTRGEPYRSVKRLAGSLRSGQTGCLEEGRYRHEGIARLRQPGTTLRAVGAAKVQVDGTIWITGGARGARLSDISLTTTDEHFPIPLKVQADDAVVSRNVITASTSSPCVVIGSDRIAHGVRIERNRIAHCGREGKFDHLIYISRTRGAVVRENLLSDNPGGWAIHLYPDADDSLIERNTIRGNLGGIIFAGDGEGMTSDRNVARDNAITGSGTRWNIESSWSGGPAGTGNLASENCLHSDGAGAPSGVGPHAGVAVVATTVAPAARCARLGFGR
jgi:hypothetical protein